MKPLIVRPEGIPAELKALPQWVDWQLETRDGKPTKVPYQPGTGRRASTTDSRTWGSFQGAFGAYERRGFAGIGLVFAESDPYVGVDFDRCRDPETGALEPWAADWVRRLGGYAEVSPSGTGVKVWVRGRKPGGRCKRTGLGSGGGAVEVYSEGRYFAVTGHALADTAVEIGEAQEALDALYREVLEAPGEAGQERRDPGGGGWGDGATLEDEEVLRRASEAANGAKFQALFAGDTGGHHGDHSAADLALCSHLAFWCRKDAAQMDRLFRRSGLMRDKWDREDYRERTLSKALEGVTEFYSPGCAANGSGGAARDPEALYGKALGGAEGERTAAVRELAAVVAGDALAADQYGERLKDGGVVNKTAFLAQVAECRRQQRRNGRKRRRHGENGEGAEVDAEEGALPAIDAGDRDLPRVVGLAWEAIQRANDPPSLFRHGGVATRIETDDTGAPVVRTLTEDRLRHTLARAAQWYRINDEGERVPALPPMHVVKDVLATPDLPLPVLTRIVEAPVFAPDGTLETAPGYHRGSQTYYAPGPGFVVPQVSERPTGAEVERARELLLGELLGDFPFTSDAERAHALALLVLPFVRSLIAGATPLHLVEKPSPGTGASLLCDVLTYPSTGHPIAAMTEGRDEDEWRKRITAKLRTGASVVLIDNLKRRLDSAAVSAVITAPVWEDRLLGASETVRIPVRCAWVATGNNPVLSSEVTRRTVRIRLDAKRDRPWLRTEFRHPDLRGWATGNRSDLVWAALTLGSAWLAAGRPLQAKPLLGMFEDWSGVMGGILSVAGVPGFLSNLDEFYRDTDTEGATWRAFVLAWWENLGEKEVGVADLWSVALAVEPPLELGDAGEKSQKTRLGKQLGTMRDRQFQFDADGEELHVRITAGGVLRRAQQWRLARVGPPGGCERVNVGERSPSASGRNPAAKEVSQGEVLPGFDQESPGEGAGNVLTRSPGSHGG